MRREEHATETYCEICDDESICPNCYGHRLTNKGKDFNSIVGLNAFIESHPGDTLCECWDYKLTPVRIKQPEPAITDILEP